MVVYYSHLSIDEVHKIHPRAYINLKSKSIISSQIRKLAQLSSFLSNTNTPGQWWIYYYIKTKCWNIECIIRGYYTHRIYIDRYTIYNAKCRIGVGG